MDRKNDKNSVPKVMQAFSMIMQFTINMLVPIVLCGALGWFIDKKFGTSFWVIILFFVGALAGFTNVYRLAMRISTGQDDRNKKS